MSLFDYLLTPKDIISASNSIYRRMSPRSVFGGILAGCILLFLVLTSTLSLDYIAMVLFLVAVFYWNMDLKVILALAFSCLVAIMAFSVLSVFGLGWLNFGAEKISVWLYFFIALGLFKSYLNFPGKESLELSSFNPERIKRKIETLKKRGIDL